MPEVNPDAIARLPKRSIIANPNCSTAQLVVALKPLHDFAKIKRVVVSTYQSVSGAGKEGMDELVHPDPRRLRRRSGRRARSLPSASPSTSSRISTASWKTATRRKSGSVRPRTKKMLDPKIKVTCTAVRVPVFIGHSESVNIEFENEISADQARDILREAPGCLVIDKHENGGYITPYESAGEDATYISRIREDATVENGLHLVRFRQPAQGCRPQRHPDRRACSSTAA